MSTKVTAASEPARAIFGVPLATRLSPLRTRSAAPQAPKEASVAQEIEDACAVHVVALLEPFGQVLGDRHENDELGRQHQRGRDDEDRDGLVGVTDELRTTNSCVIAAAAVAKQANAPQP